MLVGNSTPDGLAIRDRLARARKEGQFYITNTKRVGKLYEELRSSNSVLQTFLCGSRVFYMVLTDVPELSVYNYVCRGCVQFEQNSQAAMPTDREKATNYTEIYELVRNEPWFGFYLAALSNITVVTDVLSPLLPKAAGKTP